MFEIEINSNEDILRIGECLHDAECERTNIKYDEASQTLDIVFTERIGFEYERKSVQKVFGFLYNTLREYPAVKSHFHLEGVRRCKVETKDETWIKDEFDECEIKGHECCLVFHCWVRINLELALPPKGYLKDLEFMNFREGKVNIRLSDISLRRPEP